MDNSGNDVEISTGAGDGDNAVSNGSFKTHLEQRAVPGSGFNTPYMETLLFPIVDESAPGGDDVIIETGDNDDEIQSFDGSNIKINAGAGNNRVNLAGTGQNIDVTTKNNDDTIIAYSYETIYTGNIPQRLGSGSDLKINAGGGKNFVSIGSAWSKVTVESGNAAKGIDFIINKSEAALLNFQGNTGFNIIRNSGFQTRIFGGDNGNRLLNYGEQAYIVGGNSVDYIYSTNSEHIQIFGDNRFELDTGAADTIEVYHDVGAYIDGGAGNDDIFVGRVSDADVLAIGVDMATDIVNALLSPATSYVNDKYNMKLPSVVLNGDTSDWLLALASSINTLKEIPFVGIGLQVVSGIKTIFDNWKPGSLLNKLNYSESTVNGGKGNDKIVLDGFAPRIVKYRYGDGDDTIYYMATNRATQERETSIIDYIPIIKDKVKEATHLSTLDITSGNIDTVTVDDDNNVILEIGKGSVNLVNAAGYKFKVRENGKLTTRIYGTNEGDTIRSWDGENNFIVNGMGGNDFISNIKNTSTVDGGAGNDNIENYGSNVSISGGVGNDNICTSIHRLLKQLLQQMLLPSVPNVTLLRQLLLPAHNVTVNGGTGDDYIDAYARNVLIEYAEGDGNDVVNFFGSDDTLKIDAVGYTTERKGFDLIVHVGDGSINLKDCRFSTVNIEGHEGQPVEVSFYNGKLDAEKLSLLKLDPNEVLDVNEASNEIVIKNIDASGAATGVKVIGNVNVNKFTGSKSEDVYYIKPRLYYIKPTNSANNNIANNDETDTDEGDEVSIVTVRTGGGDDTVYGGGGADMSDGGEEKSMLYVYKAGDGHDVINYFGAKDTLRILGGTFSVDTVESNIVITVGDGSITLVDAETLPPINVDGVLSEEFNPDPLIVNDSIISFLTLSDRKAVDASARENAIQIAGNNLDNSIVGGAGNDTLSGEESDDTLTGGAGNDIFVYTNGNDVIADYAAGDKIALAGMSISDITDATVDDDITLTFDEDSTKTLTINHAAGQEILINDTAYEIANNIISSADDKSATLVSSFSGTLDASDYNAVDATAVKEGVMITGGNSLLGSNFDDSLFGTAGADTLNGSEGNDSLTGGDGADLFVYSAGNDTVADYAAGDEISLGAAIDNASLNGNSAVLTFGNETLTIYYAKGKELTLTGVDGKELKTVIGGMFLNNGADKNVTLAANDEFADASARKTAIKITGNKLANSIVGGTKNDSLYGGNGDDTLNGGKGNDKLYGQNNNDNLYGEDGEDTLYGGAGNDTLWGGYGADVFIYSDGDDIIRDFDDNDLLQITDDFTAAYISSTNRISFRVGQGSIILENFSATDFHVNDDIYKINESTFEKQ